MRNIAASLRPVPPKPRRNRRSAVAPLEPSEDARKSGTHLLAVPATLGQLDPFLALALQ